MYEYDPTPFRGVFERDFGYLAGVARNASRFADRPALGEAEVSLTVDGTTTNTGKRGDVAVIGRNVKHESKNAGKAGDVVIVAIK